MLGILNDAKSKREKIDNTELTRRLNKITPFEETSKDEVSANVNNNPILWNHPGRLRVTDIRERARLRREADQAISGGGGKARITDNVRDFIEKIKNQKITGKKRIIIRDETGGCCWGLQEI